MLFMKFMKCNYTILGKAKNSLTLYFFDDRKHKKVKEGKKKKMKKMKFCVGLTKIMTLVVEIAVILLQKSETHKKSEPMGDSKVRWG